MSTANDQVDASFADLGQLSSMQNLQRQSRRHQGLQGSAVIILDRHVSGVENWSCNRDWTGYLITEDLVTRILDHTQDVRQGEKKDQDAKNRNTQLPTLHLASAANGNHDQHRYHGFGLLLDVTKEISNKGNPAHESRVPRGCTLTHVHAAWVMQFDTVA